MNMPSIPTDDAITLTHESAITILHNIPEYARVVFGSDTRYAMSDHECCLRETHSSFTRTKAIAHLDEHEVRNIPRIISVCVYSYLSR